MPAKNGIQASIHRDGANEDCLHELPYDPSETERLPPELQAVSAISRIQHPDEAGASRIHIHIKLDASMSLVIHTLWFVVEVNGKVTNRWLYTEKGFQNSLGCKIFTHKDFISGQTMDDIVPLSVRQNDSVTVKVLKSQIHINEKLRILKVDKESSIFQAGQLIQKLPSKRRYAVGDNGTTAVHVTLEKAEHPLAVLTWEFKSKGALESLLVIPRGPFLPKFCVLPDIDLLQLPRTAFLQNRNLTKNLLPKTIDNMAYYDLKRGGKTDQEVLQELHIRALRIVANTGNRDEYAVAALELAGQAYDANSKEEASLKEIIDTEAHAFIEWDKLGDKDHIRLCIEQTTVAQDPLNNDEAEDLPYRKMKAYGVNRLRELNYYTALAQVLILQAEEAKKFLEVQKLNKQARAKVNEQGSQKAGRKRTTETEAENEQDMPSSSKKAKVDKVSSIPSENVESGEIDSELDAPNAPKSNNKDST